MKTSVVNVIQHEGLDVFDLQIFCYHLSSLRHRVQYFFDLSRKSLGLTGGLFQAMMNIRLLSCYIITFAVRNRVARWYILKPKIPICVIF
jgi:hypothetical protein